MITEQLSILFLRVPGSQREVNGKSAGSQREVNAKATSQVQETQQDWLTFHYCQKK